MFLKGQKIILTTTKSKNKIVTLKTFSKDFVLHTTTTHAEKDVVMHAFNSQTNLNKDTKPVFNVMLCKIKKNG